MVSLTKRNDNWLVSGMILLKSRGLSDPHVDSQIPMGRSGERPERTELNDPSLISNASEVQASVVHISPPRHRHHRHRH